MTLSPGTRLGPYEVLGPLGAGGMGEVYRARDVNLGRDVALKVLPGDFVDDRDWRRRFDREARLLASLSHPNLATVHWFDAEASPPFLVMELVPGPTLADRAPGPPRSTDQVIDVLRQVAAGLAAAHDAGIVHRDLKPANVKITAEGVVKILDFGLAKSVRDDGDGAGLATTMTCGPTSEGAVVGTAPYMSPEQAVGKPVDRRTDLWAFGCLGYELLAGRRAFDGPTATETIAAVLRGDPDWEAVPATTPARLLEVLRRCLQKDPAQRLRDARDLTLTLDDIQTAAPAPPGAAAVAASSPSIATPGARVARSTMLAWAIAGAAVGAAATIWWSSRQTGPAETPQWTRFTQLTDLAGVEDEPAISADGRSIAYSRAANGRAGIYVQRVGGHTALLVASDAGQNLRSPGFSPDGSRIAFHESDADGGVFVVGATGESVRRLTEFGFHPSWSNDGRHLVFATEEAREANARYSISSLWTVDATGGTPKKIHDGDAVQPAWSPSGRRIAFAAAATNGQKDLFTIPADGGRAVAVTNDPALDGEPAWSPDGRFLYFGSDRGGFVNLWRIGIDEASGNPRGSPELVTGSVAATADKASLSRDGTKLVFRSRPSSANPCVASFDAAARTAGAATPIFERSGILRVADVSADGAWLALSNQGEVQEDIFISRADGRDLRRLTDDPFRDRAPVFAPDGRHIAFYSNRGGDGLQIWTIGVDGSGLTQVTAVDPADLNFPNYDPASGHLVATGVRTHRVLVFDLAKPQPIAIADELPRIAIDNGWFVAGRWSPDGRRMLGPILTAAGGALGLGLYDLTSRQAQRIPGAPNLVTGASWLPDSRRIGYCLGGNIVVVDADSGQRTVVPAPVISNGTLGTCVFAANGASIYMSVQRIEADIWLVER